MYILWLISAHRAPRILTALRSYLVIYLDDLCFPLIIAHLRELVMAAPPYTTGASD